MKSEAQRKALLEEAQRERLEAEGLTAQAEGVLRQASDLERRADDKKRHAQDIARQLGEARTAGDTHESLATVRHAESYVRDHMAEGSAELAALLKRKAEIDAMTAAALSALEGFDAEARTTAAEGERSAFKAALHDLSASAQKISAEHLQLEAAHLRHGADESRGKAAELDAARAQLLQSAAEDSGQAAALRASGEELQQQARLKLELSRRREDEARA